MGIRAFGKYELLEVLGRGGFGTVYRARETLLDVERAVKVLHPALAADPEFIERFRREARITARLEHPNIVPVYEVDETDGAYYLAMRYLPGGSLNDLLKRVGRLPFARATEITRQVASALDHAYQQPEKLVHRDVKPGNILIETDGTARLSDFGFAKALTGTGSASLSVSGGMIGTPAYMAPEAWRSQPAAPAADVYSLACVFYEILTGQVLFSGDSPPEIMTRHVLDGPQFPAAWPEGTPEGVDAVLAKALSRDPQGRYASAGEFARALEETLKVSAPTPPLARPLGQVPAARGGISPIPSPAGPSPAVEQTPKVVETFRGSVPQGVKPKSRRFPWKWLGLGGGLLVGLCLIGLILISKIFTTSSPEIFPQPTAVVASSNTPIPQLPTETLVSQSPTETTVPTLGGGSGQIAFVSDRDGNAEIYVMNADGSGQTNLTVNSALDACPAWSPDGRQIAFSSDRQDDNVEIYVMNADGSGVVRLTYQEAENACPDWSPDGRQIAFVSWQDGNPEIYVMNADGSGLTNLTNNEAFDGFPAWSPDGRQIAFSSNMDGNIEIYVMNADGSGVTQLTDNDPGNDAPAWSPDGRLIAFVGLEGDGSSDIYVMNTDGSGRINLTNDVFDISDLSWSPDGRRIGFASRRPEQWDIYVINTDGSGLTQLTNNQAMDVYISWAP